MKRSETLKGADLASHERPAGHACGHGHPQPERGPCARGWISISLHQASQPYPGLETPVKHPELVNMVIFRENTEDVYAGIEFSAKSAEAEKLGSFLRNELNCAALPPDAAIGIKPMTEKARNG